MKRLKNEGKGNSEKEMRQIFAKWKIGEYLRQLSVVVMGIIITFKGNDIITNYHQQQEVTQTLQLVKSELLANKEELQTMQESLLVDRSGANFLLKYKDRITQAPSDSLKFYHNTPFRWRTFKYTYDAMEMLKISGLMQKIKNKELAMEIINVYAAIQGASVVYQLHNNSKLESAKTLSDNLNLRRLLSIASNLSEVEFWSSFFKEIDGLMFISQIPEYVGDKIPFNAAIVAIDETITAINREYPV